MTDPKQLYSVVDHPTRGRITTDIQATGLKFDDGDGTSGNVIDDLRIRVTRLEGALVALGLMLLFAVGGLYLYMGSTISPIEKNLAALSREVGVTGAKVDALSTRIDGTDKRLDRMDAKLDTIIERLPAKH